MNVESEGRIIARGWWSWKFLLKIKIKIEIGTCGFVSLEAKTIGKEIELKDNRFPILIVYNIL